MDLRAIAAMAMDEALADTQVEDKMPGPVGVKTPKVPKIPSANANNGSKNTQNANQNAMASANKDMMKALESPLEKHDRETHGGNYEGGRCKFRDKLVSEVQAAGGDPSQIKGLQGKNGEKYEVGNAESGATKFTAEKSAMDDAKKALDAIDPEKSPYDYNKAVQEFINKRNDYLAKALGQNELDSVQKLCEKAKSGNQGIIDKIRNFFSNKKLTPDQEVAKKMIDDAIAKKDAESKADQARISAMRNAYADEWDEEIDAINNAATGYVVNAADFGGSGKYAKGSDGNWYELDESGQSAKADGIVMSAEEFAAYGFELDDDLEKKKVKNRPMDELKKAVEDAENAYRNDQTTENFRAMTDARKALKTREDNPTPSDLKSQWESATNDLKVAQKEQMTANAEYNRVMKDDKATAQEKKDAEEKKNAAEAKVAELEQKESEAKDRFYNTPPEDDNTEAEETEDPGDKADEQVDASQQQQPQGQNQEAQPDEGTNNEYTIKGKKYIDTSDMGFFEGLSAAFKAGWKGQEIVTSWDKMTGRWDQIKASDPKMRKEMDALQQAAGGAAIESGLKKMMEAKLADENASEEEKLLAQSVIDMINSGAKGEKVSKALQDGLSAIAKRNNANAESEAKVNKSDAEVLRKDAETAANMQRKDADLAFKQKMAEQNSRIKNGIVDPNDPPEVQAAAQAKVKLNQRQLKNDAIKNGDVNSPYLADDPGAQAAAQAALDARNGKAMDANTKRMQEAAKNGRTSYTDEKGVEHQLEGDMLKLAQANAENAFIKANADKIKNGIEPEGNTSQAIKDMCAANKKLNETRQATASAQQSAAESRASSAEETRKLNEKKNAEYDREHQTSVFADENPGYLDELADEIATNPDNLSTGDLGVIQAAADRLQKPLTDKERIETLEKIAKVLANGQTQNQKNLAARARTAIAEAKAKYADRAEYAKAVAAEERAEQLAIKGERLDAMEEAKLRKLEGQAKEHFDRPYGEDNADLVDAYRGMIEEVAKKDPERAKILDGHLRALDGATNKKDARASINALSNELTKYRREQGLNKKGKASAITPINREDLEPADQAVYDEIQSGFSGTPMDDAKNGAPTLDDNTKKYLAEMKTLSDEFAKVDPTTGKGTMNLTEYQKKVNDLKQKYGIKIPDPKELKAGRVAETDSYGADQIYQKTDQDAKKKAARDWREAEEHTAVQEWLKDTCGDSASIEPNSYDPNQGPNETHFRIKLNGKNGADIKKRIVDLETKLGITGIRIDTNTGKNECTVYIPEPKDQANRTFVSARDMLIDSKTGKVRKEIAEAGIAIPVGIGQDGKPIIFDPTRSGIPHTSIVGMTNSGKSKLVETILHANIMKGNKNCQVFVLDAKGPLAERFKGMNGVTAVGPAHVKQALNQILAEARKRNKFVQEQGFANVNDYNAAHPDKPMPYMPVIFDEMKLGFDNDPETRDLLNTILRETRSAGVHVIGTSQDMKASSFPLDIRNGFGNKVVLKSDETTARLNGASEAVNSLGLGDGYLVREGESNVRFQAANLTDAEHEGFKMRHNARVKPKTPNKPTNPPNNPTPPPNSPTTNTSQLSAGGKITSGATNQSNNVKITKNDSYDNAIGEYEKSVKNGAAREDIKKHRRNVLNKTRDIIRNSLGKGDVPSFQEVSNTTNPVLNGDELNTAQTEIDDIRKKLAGLKKAITTRDGYGEYDPKLATNEERKQIDDLRTKLFDLNKKVSDSVAPLSDRHKKIAEHIVKNNSLNFEHRDGSVGPVVESGGRYFVTMNINGKTVPFYRSSGRGGKIDVEANKWYPYFGIHDNGVWLNKSDGKDIPRYYGSSQLRAICEELDRQYPSGSSDGKEYAVSSNSPDHASTFGEHCLIASSNMSLGDVAINNDEEGVHDKLAANINLVRSWVDGL